MSSSTAMHISIKTYSEDDLAERDLDQVEHFLGEARRARSQIGGYIARLTSAREFLKTKHTPTPPETEQNNGPETDEKGDGDTDNDKTPDQETSEQQEEPPPAPKPSGRQEMAERRRAERLERYPFVAAALNAGLINVEQADLLTGADLPIQVVAGLLKDAIDSRDTDHTRQLVRDAVTKHDKLNPKARYARQQNLRAFTWGIDNDGCYWFWLKTDPITGAQIIDRLENADRAQWQNNDKKKHKRKRRGPRPGGRSATQRRADAFTGLLLNASKGSKPGAHLVIDAQTLLELTNPDAIARTLYGNEVPALAWQQLVEQRAEIFAWVLAADGLEMVLGRDSRHASQVQKIALAIRDAACIWKGCDRTASACDAHHLHEWDHHGPTDIANLTLLCPHHHQKLHRMGSYLKPGNTPGEWLIIQHHTHREIDHWTNPPNPHTRTRPQPNHGLRPDLQAS